MCNNIVCRDQTAHLKVFFYYDVHMAHLCSEHAAVLCNQQFDMPHLPDISFCTPALATAPVITVALVTVGLATVAVVTVTLVTVGLVPGTLAVHS